MILLQDLHCGVDPEARVSTSNEVVARKENERAQTGQRQTDTKSLALHFAASEQTAQPDSTKGMSDLIWAIK